MKVLFVASGKNESKPSPILINQAKSLEKFGIMVEYFLITGGGIWNYLLSVFELKNEIKKNKYDIIHAHYAFSGYTAGLTSFNPVVVSLMGTDINKSKIFNYFTKLFIHRIWRYTIVKSEKMNMILQENLKVLPNGVNLKHFYQIEKKECKMKLGWNTDKLQVLFLANPNRFEKNFELLKNSVDYLNNNDIEIQINYNINNKKLLFYFNAADIIVLSSLWEGSPNVIKEAMACNKPIVSTAVGDVEWLLDGLEGCYISDFSVEKYSECLLKAVEFAKTKKHTKGRERLIELGLDSETVAKKIVNIYKQVLSKN